MAGSAPCYTGPVQHLTAAGYDVDYVLYVDRDLPDV